MICTPKDCNGYLHYDAYLGLCDYYHHTGHRRGCPAGKGCTRKETGKKPRAKNWDKETARQLWQQGHSDAEIARRVGVSGATIGLIRKKVWEVQDT